MTDARTDARTDGAARRRTLLTRAAFAAWGCAMAFETLRPLGWLTPVAFWSFFSTTMASVDIAQNVALYLPFGWIARRARWPLWRTAAAALAASALVEFVQQWIPGRASSASDLTFNTLGAMLAWRMAAPVVRPRWRIGVVCGVFAGALALHLINTQWPGRVQRADGNGAVAEVLRQPCPADAPASALCIALTNAGDRDNQYVRVVGPDERTYARVQRDARAARGARLSRDDCVLMSFESTVGAMWRMRPPLTAACGITDERDSVLAVQVDPRREHEGSAGWRPTRASVWLWPVWPFTAYRPAVLRAAGALVFVAGAALFLAMAPWWLPAGYLAGLQLLAFAAHMRGPAWWDVGWALLVWGAALTLVRADAWWRDTRAPAQRPAV